MVETGDNRGICCMGTAKAFYRSSIKHGSSTNSVELRELTVIWSIMGFAHQ